MRLQELPEARKWLSPTIHIRTSPTVYRYGVVTALYNVIWSYIGYSNANYSLSETKNPIRTLKIAAPSAIIFVSIVYMLVNVGGLRF